MSRGPGCWQRGILAAVEEEEAVYLRRLLAEDCSRSQYEALRRAAHRLAETGRIELWGHGLRRGNAPDLIVARLGCGWVEARDTADKGCVVPEREPTQRLDEETER